MVLPSMLEPYRVYIINGFVGVGLGLLTQGLMKTETINVKSFKSGAISFLTVGVGTYLSQMVDKDLSKM